MKKHLIILGLIILTLNLTGFTYNQQNQPQIKSSQLASFFNNNQGCALFFDQKNNTYQQYNTYLLAVRTSPCSTFKIPATMIGLKYGVIQDQNTVFKWDGQKRFFPFWNQDLNLQQAFSLSAVWYFEKLAQQIGLEEMTKAVRKINYGNNDLSSGGTFWLDSSLKISPKEQVEFLKKLFNHQLSDYTPEEINILKSIMYKGELNGGKLYGKTGTSKNNNNAWFVGCFEKKQAHIYFALRLHSGNEVTGPQAEKITREIIQSKY